MFNPLYYLRWALELVGGIPAALLGMLGFDRSRVEGSIAGKSPQRHVEVVTLIAGVLTILALLDWMEPVKRLSPRGFRVKHGPRCTATRVAPRAARTARR